MKKLLQLLVVSLLLTGNIYSQNPIVQQVINSVDIDSLVYFVRELSGDVATTINGQPYTILSRNKNQPGNDKAADYIKERLEYYGLTAYDQWWTATGRNVYAVQPGTDFPNQYYIVCAHYDDMPSGTTAPGADDNASGTAAVLEAARILSQYSFSYTIMYALWDEEEQGLIGSNYFATQAYNTGDSILGVLNLDMIAYDGNNDGKFEIHTRSVGNSIALKDEIVNVNTTYNIGVIPIIKNPGSTYSDHASFWSKGYGAILLIEDNADFHPFYHTINDKIQYFNVPYFEKMSKLAISTLSTLAVIHIVPVELVAFSAITSSDKVTLNWSTASEINNRGFEIERKVFNPQSSVSNSEWRIVGYVDGKGTTTDFTRYTFVDQLNEQGKYSYRLKQIDFDGSINYSNEIEVDFIGVTEYALLQNYPNPFNPSTVISYQLPVDSKVQLKIYDVLGTEIITLVNESKSAGKHDVSFDAGKLSSGTYFYTILADGFVQTKKMLLVK